MAVEPQQFKTGMRRLAAGVTIVTTNWEGTRRGLTATAICSVSLAPPTLLCCVNRASAAHEAICASGTVAVNVLTAADLALAECFGGAEFGEARFALGQWATLVTGAPVLESALAAFDCRISRVIEAGTHTVFLAEVVATRADGPGEPLLYLEGAYGGFSPLAAAFP
jgi:flavin reductase (DIM6/NTAB) family NADH-FMN oxidoreductase RutF